MIRRRGKPQIMKQHLMKGMESWLKKAPLGCYIPSPQIKKQIKFFQCNDRPDQIKGQKNIYIGLNGSKEKVAVAPGERVFITCNEYDEVEFSEKKTPFEVEFAMLKNGSLEAILSTQFTSNENVIIDKKQRFVLQKGVNESKGTDISPMLENLSKGVSILAPDRLLELYGGAAFDEEKRQYRFVIEERERKVYMIREGDFLIWSEGGWLKHTGETIGKPLLYIKSLSKQKCDYQLWDEKGEVSKSGTLPVNAIQPPFLQTAEVFRSVQYRTENSVMCQLGMKNVILRSGDWLVRSKSGWKNIQSIDEMKALLTYGMVGDLFIFDGVIEKDGKKVFKGHFFDADRITAQVVELSLKEKKDRKNNKKGIDLTSKNLPGKGSRWKK